MYERGHRFHTTKYRLNMIEWDLGIIVVVEINYFLLFDGPQKNIPRKSNKTKNLNFKPSMLLLS